MNLSLGTAQFGSAYGVTHTQGIPSKYDVFNILDMFVEDGNSFLDTAQDYGDAQKKISQWLRKKEPNSISINITTKIHIKTNADIKSFHSNVIKICDDLGVKNIYGVLIHNPSDILKLNCWNELNDHFSSLKKLGIVKKTGVSIYDAAEILSLYNKIPEINIIQCPINILDQRFLQADFQNFCINKNIEIHARSLFLQGLLLVNYIPEKVLNSDTKEILEKYRNFLKDNCLEPMEACCLFAYQNKEKVSSWVIGFNFPKELKEFLHQLKQTINKKSISFDEFSKDAAIDPRTWGYVKK